MPKQLLVVLSFLLTGLRPQNTCSDLMSQLVRLNWLLLSCVLQLHVVDSMPGHEVLCYSSSH